MGELISLDAALVDSGLLDADEPDHAPAAAVHGHRMGDNLRSPLLSLRFRHVRSPGSLDHAHNVSGSGSAAVNIPGEYGAPEGDAEELRAVLIDATNDKSGHEVVLVLVVYEPED